MVLPGLRKLVTYVFIAVLISSPISECSAQMLSAELNPGCQNCTAKKIAYVSVCYKDAESSVHFIITMQDGKFTPSIFVAESDRNSSVLFDWDAIINNNATRQSIHLKNASFSGLVFSTFYKYEDINDVADVSKAIGKVEKMLTRYVFWELIRYDPIVNSSTNLLSVVIRAYDAVPFKLFQRKGGYIEIEFAFANRDRYPDRAPFTLLIGGLTARVKVTFYRMHAPYPTSRWALGLVLVANLSLPDCVPFNQSSITSIDDEPSPGSFKDVAVQVGNQSYTAWRSVCYVSALSTELKTSRGVTASQQACLDTTTRRALREASLLPFLFGPSSNLTLRQINVSFGDPGDGFYAASSYIDWSFTFGVGPQRSSQFTGLFYAVLLLIVLVLTVCVCLTVYFVTARFGLKPRRESCERKLLDDTNADEDEGSRSAPPEHTNPAFLADTVV